MNLSHSEFVSTLSAYGPSSATLLALLIALPFLPGIIYALGSGSVWIVFSFLWICAKMLTSVYHIAKISFLMFCLGGIKFVGWMLAGYDRMCCSTATTTLKSQLQSSTTLKGWMAVAEQLDESRQEWKDDVGEDAGSDSLINLGLLKHSTQELLDALAGCGVDCGEVDNSSDSLSQSTPLPPSESPGMLRRQASSTPYGRACRLAEVLARHLKRNHANVDAPALHSHCLTGTKTSVEVFDAALLRAVSIVLHTPHLPLEEKARVFRNGLASLGRLALCLSGGGSLSMCHLGVIRALLHGGCCPTVVSGSSGGSIQAAMLACKTDDELLHDIISNDISTRYMGGKDGVRFFPPMGEQMFNFASTRMLMDNAAFSRCTRRYYQDVTFEEAFRRTGRHVSITVSQDVNNDRSNVSHAAAPTARHMLLNHITTPNVLLWSAVTASCCLPGIMRPVELYAKELGDDGKEHVVAIFGGMKFCDGSLYGDIPLDRLKELFGVTSFVVSQVNPHVRPWMKSQGEGSAGSTGAVSAELHGTNDLIIQAEELINDKLRHNLRVLAKLRLIPRFFGQDMSYTMTQAYNGPGCINIMPNLTLTDTFKAIQNPTVADCKSFIENGEKATWPKIASIRRLHAIEQALVDALESVTGQMPSNYAGRGGLLSASTSLSDLQHPIPFETGMRRRSSSELNLNVEAAGAAAPSFVPAAAHSRRPNISAATPITGSSVGGGSGSSSSKLASESPQAIASSGLTIEQEMVSVLAQIDVLQGRYRELRQSLASTPHSLPSSPVCKPKPGINSCTQTEQAAANQ